LYGYIDMSEQYPIKLTFSPEKWRLFAARRDDPAFHRFAEKIWERDDYTCIYCGFHAYQYQEVINIDGNYRKASLDNAVTACCLCAQCFFLDAVGKNDYGGGFLIHMPSLSQNEINGLCHVLFCSMYNASDYRDQSQMIYRDLKLRSQIVERELGEGMSDPARLAQVMIEGEHLIDSPQDKQDKLLKDLRLLPSVTKFSQQIETWSMAAREELAEYSAA